MVGETLAKAGEQMLENREKYFWLHSGRGLRSIRELANYIPQMPHEEFLFHVGDGKNDFADWIDGVFEGQHELAEKLRATRTRQEFQTALYNHLIRKEERDIQTRAKQHKEEHQAAILSDDKEFAAFHEREAKRKDQLADRFDAVAHRMEEGLDPEEPKEVTKRIEALEEHRVEIQRRISEARKAGKDPLIADLTLRPVKAKMAYYRVSRDDKDYQQIEMILKDAEEELEEELVRQEPDVKKEVEERAKRLIKQELGGMGDSGKDDEASGVNRKQDGAEKDGVAVGSAPKNVSGSDDGGAA